MIPQTLMKRMDGNDAENNGCNWSDFEVRDKRMYLKQNLNLYR